MNDSFTETEIESPSSLSALSPRVLNALTRGGILNLQFLTVSPEEHVRTIIGIGEEAMHEIRCLLKLAGRDFFPPRSWKGCGCPPCVCDRERVRARQAGRGARVFAWLDEAPEDDRPLPGNVVPFRRKAAKPEEAGA